MISEGFLIGIQLHTDQTKFIKKLMDNKLLTIRAAENVVRILPPLNVKKNEMHSFILFRFKFFYFFLGLSSCLGLPPQCSKKP